MPAPGERIAAVDWITKSPLGVDPGGLCCVLKLRVFQQSCCKVLPLS